MKNLYVCEKCGKVFNNYDEAWDCENSHQTVDVLYNFQMHYNSDTDLPTAIWDDKGISPYPAFVVLRGNKVTESGDWERAVMPNGNEVYVYNAVCYQRVDGKLPKGIPALHEYDNAMYLRQMKENEATDSDEEG